MGIPVLTGALFRLPAGILTDKFGGKPVYGILLLLLLIATNSLHNTIVSANVSAYGAAADSYRN